MPGSRILCLLAVLLSVPAWAGAPVESNELNWLIKPEGSPRAGERRQKPPEAFARIQADGNFVPPRLAEGDAARLLQAIATQDKATAKALLDRGVTPNGRDYWGDSPLMAAVRQDSIELVQVLLDAGATTEVAWRGYTPLAMAVINNNRPIARLLLRAGANPDRKMTDGDTPLHAAVRRGHVEMVAVLAAARPDFRRYDVDGRTALGLAATLAQYDIATILIEHGAPIEIGNKYAHSPLWLANAFNDPKMLRLLLEHGADPRDISLESLN